MENIEEPVPLVLLVLGSNSDRFPDLVDVADGGHLKLGYARPGPIEDEDGQNAFTGNERGDRLDVFGERRRDMRSRFLR